MSASASTSNIDIKVDSLLGKMTLKEKLGQLNQLSPWNHDEIAKRVEAGEVGSLLNISDPAQIIAMQHIAVEKSRLGIPLLIGRDVIHGYKTIFPIPLGQAASFNSLMVERGARIAATEASADGIKWTFAPMIDIARDCRWGRIAESFGEEPHLTSVMGAAMVRGFQDTDMTRPSSLAACAKHFVGYGAAEGGRDYNSTYIPERRMRNVYLPPFQSAADAGCATFMTSFNDNDGIPSTGNRHLLTDILRNEWGFKGMVVTDWCSATEMIAHGFAKNRKDAAEKAINAGVDMDMVSECFINNLEKSVADGSVDMATIDNAVRNVLRLKYQLGLFDNPYATTPRSLHYDPVHLATARQAAEESIILLENRNNTLPLSSDVRKILVVGPMANAPHDQLGTWVFDGEKEHTVTPLQALRDLYGDKVQIIFEPALPYTRSTDASAFARAVKAAKRVDAIIAFVGEESILTGEAHSLADCKLQGAQTELITALAATGKPLVTIVMAGRPLVLTQEALTSDALLFSFHPGTMGGPAIADILFGKVNPSAKTPATFPRMVGQVPIYCAQNNTGRPANANEILLKDIPLEVGQTSTGCRSFYLDAGTGPLYPFGYGLSYTNFRYDNLRLASDTIASDGNILASVNITNTGTCPGTEIAQLYVRDKVGSTARPVKELKGFDRITLQPGQTQTVTFSLPVSALAFYGLNNTYAVEPGDFRLWIAPNSASGPFIDFTVVE